VTQLHQGVPHRAETLSLLNEAYDGWGTSDYFRWKYDLYPDYLPETHGFYIEADGDLAAFRRAFYKEVVGPTRTSSVFVLGDTAVHPAYRGQGLYSRLHEETMAFSDRQGAQRVTTFNRKTNLTYEANLDRGWQYRELPLEIRILSPDVVLRQYAALAIGDHPVVDTVADRLGDRIRLSTSDGTVSLRECVTSETDTERLPLSVELPLSDRALVGLIDLACSDTIEPLGPLVDGWLHGDGRSGRADSREQATDDAYRVRCKQSVSTAEFESIIGLYDPDTVSFRRTATDIRHILQYPDCDVVLVTREAELVGYAVVGSRSNGNVLEGRVLELRVDHEAAFDVLTDEIERLAADRGYDLVIVFSERSPGELWASVDQQVLMWTDLEGSSAPLVDSCRISLYDVV